MNALKLTVYAVVLFGFSYKTMADSSCVNAFTAAGVDIPTIEFLIEGSGDVVERFYLPALKEARDERHGKRKVLATFTGFTGAKDTPEQLAKRDRIRSNIEAAGFTYIDKADPAQKAVYDKMAPDYVVLAAGAGMQRKLSEHWINRDKQKDGLGPIRIFTEKPLEASVDAARDFRDSFAPGDSRVMAMDHYRPKLNLKPEDVVEIEKFLGGLKSFESYITEDRSGSDTQAALATNNHRDGAVELEERGKVLAAGLATDLVPHSLAMLDWFIATSTLKPTEVKAGRYQGVDGDPLKPTTIPNETYFAADVAAQDNHGNAITGKIVVGKGLRVRKYGKELEGNAKVLELEGQNGNRIVFDLRGGGTGGSTATYFNPGGKVEKTAALQSKPYNALFGGIIDGKSETNGMAFPLKQGVIFREKLAQLLKGARNVELPMYAGGMGGIHSRSAPFVEDLWENLPTLPDGEIMVTGGGGTMGLGFTYRFSKVAGLKVIVSDPAKTAQAAIQSLGNDVDIVLVKDVESAVAKLQRPRKVMVFAPNAKVSDSILNKLSVVLEPGDIVVDGGNKNWEDTVNWQRLFGEKGIHLIGMGVSGGEAGARTGSSMMAGGNSEAWEKVRPYYEAIAGRVPHIDKPIEFTPSVSLVGPGGSGHFVKMAHNGIEYVEMQLYAEIYDILKKVGVSNGEMEQLFDKWNQTELKAFLLNTAARVANFPDGDTGIPLVEKIVAVAKQKGTGMWSSRNALEVQAYAPTLPEAVFARNATEMTARFKSYLDLAGPETAPLSSEQRTQLIKDIPQALYAARLLDFSQGFNLLELASKKYFDGKVDFANLTNTWRTGSILQGHMLDQLHREFKNNPEYAGPLDSPMLRRKLSQYQQALRNVATLARNQGVPAPALSSLITYYDTVRARQLPANFLQAMRDYFGAHSFQRIDDPSGAQHHSEWGVPAAERQ